MAGLNQNAWYAYDYMQKKGYSPVQASGIVGNLYQESTMMTNARNKGDGRDGSDSVGVGQWNGDRARAFNAFAGQEGRDANTLDTQLDFLDHELKTTETGAYKRLMASENVHDATAAMISYERPQGYSAKNPTAGHGWDNRYSHANALYNGTGRDGAEVAPVGDLGPITPMGVAPNAQAVAQGPTPMGVTPAAAAPANPGISIGGFKLPQLTSVMGVDLAKAGKVGTEWAEQQQKQDDKMNQASAQALAQGQARVNSAQPVQMLTAATDPNAFHSVAPTQARGGNQSIDPNRLAALMAQMRQQKGRA